MSVVVAIKENGRVYLGCDSQATKGGTRTTLKNPNNYKIWNVLGVEACAMGHVGFVREACVVRLLDDLVRDIDVYRDAIDFGFVVRRVVPAIIDALNDARFRDPEETFTGFDSSYFFAYKDRLYTIMSDGAVMEIDDYAAIGSGRDQAIGSLLSTEGQDPVTRIVKAIKSSAASDIYVDYPIVLLDTVEQTFHVVTEDNEKEFLKKKGKENA